MNKNHYGVIVDSVNPITGVEQNNRVVWLIEEMINGICLQCEAAIKEHGDVDGYNEDCPECKEWEHYCLDYLECTDHTHLIGGWILDTKTGQYELDKNAEYSAIMGEVYTQIVWSKTTVKCALCSPCYPGQGDIGSEGEYTAYTLPADLY